MKQNTLDDALTIVVALFGVGMALFVGYLGLSMVTAMNTHSLLNWLLPLGFIITSVWIGFTSLRNLKRSLFPTPQAQRPQAQVVLHNRQSDELDQYPGAWCGENIPLEAQIENLKKAGLSMDHGNSVDQLLNEWPREAYEQDPYGLLLFMYGSGFCQRGWDFDMECVTSEGDYTAAFEPLVRISGQPDSVANLSDELDMAASAWSVRYTLNGQVRKLTARLDRDWVDPDVLEAFLKDIEAHSESGQRYWYADNGQALTFFFLSDEEAEAINELRPGILMR